MDPFPPHPPSIFTVILIPPSILSLFFLTSSPLPSLALVKCSSRLPSSSRSVWKKTVSNLVSIWRVQFCHYPVCVCGSFFLFPWYHMGHTHTHTHTFPPPESQLTEIVVPTFGWWYSHPVVHVDIRVAVYLALSQMNSFIIAWHHDYSSFITTFVAITRSLHKSLQN